MVMLRFILYIISFVLLGIGLVVLLIHTEAGLSIIMVGIIQLVFLGLKHVWRAMQDGIYAVKHNGDK